MSDWMQHAITSLKLATIWPSILGAALAIALEFRRHTWATALIALFSGAFVAFIATEPVVEFLRLEGSSGHAVAGVLGITGRNIIVAALSMSKDPVETWKSFWTKK
jgi:hypothetical protein